MPLAIALLLLRLGAGGMLLAGHGWEKLVSFPDKSAAFPDPLGVGSPLSLSLAVFAEVACSLLVVLGVRTRLAAVPPLVTMLVAAFVVHAGDPWAKKELALLYALPFLTLVIVGGGRYSVDALLAGRPRRTRVTV
jgi:putative oxidoreductase